MINIEASEVFLLLITGLGGILVYFFKKLVDKIETISNDISEMKILMEGHEQNLEFQEQRISKIEMKLEKIDK